MMKKYYYKKKMKISDKNIEIFEDIIFSYPEIIDFGDNIYIGPRAKIFGKGKLKLADNIIIGNDFSAYTSVHDYNGGYIPYGFDDIVKSITIEDGVWIGANVSIMPGVTIGEGAVIGLGSVVTKDVEKFKIVAGNPARVINERNSESYYQMKKKKQYYLDEKRNKH